MRTVPEDLSAALAGGVTTLCWCWRITRRDGQVSGFTDHDRDLVFDGVTYTAGSLILTAVTAVPSSDERRTRRSELPNV